MIISNKMFIVEYIEHIYHVHQYIVHMFEYIA